MSDAPEVQAYPRENLYYAVDGFIGTNPNFTLTRRITERKSSQAEIGQFTILCFGKELVYVMNSKDDTQYDSHKTSGSFKSKTAK